MRHLQCGSCTVLYCTACREEEYRSVMSQMKNQAAFLYSCKAADKACMRSAAQSLQMCAALERSAKAMITTPNCKS